MLWNSAYVCYRFLNGVFLELHYSTKIYILFYKAKALEMILENELVCCSYFFCNFVLSWDFFQAEIYGLMWSSIARTYIEYLVDGDRSVCEQAYPYKKLLNFAPWKAISLASISIVSMLKGAEQILIEIYFGILLTFRLTLPAWGQTGLASIVN